MKINKTIALVGYRKEAIQIAEDMFESVHIVVPEGTKVSKKLKQSQVHFFNSKDITPELPKTLHLCLPLTESGVLLAAKIKEKYNCAGYTLELSTCSHEKLILKQKTNNSELKITDYRVITEDTSAADLMQKLGLPLVIKQQNSSGSRGLRYCHTLDEIKQHMQPGYIAEAFIDGKEYSAEVFVKNGQPVFHNFTNYYKHLKINVLPHKFQTDLHGKLMTFIQELVQTFNVTTAFLHIEFFLSKEETITLGEFAIRPPGGYIMKLLSLSYNFSAWESYFKLFLDKQIDLPSQHTDYSCAVILHPGEGKLESISGLDTIKNLSSFYSLQLKKSAGDQVLDRQGSGQNIGHIILKNKKQKALIDDLKSLEENFKINMIT